MTRSGFLFPIFAAVLPLLGADEVLYSSRVYRVSGRSYEQIDSLQPGGKPRTLTTTPRHHRNPMGSQDGRRIYFLGGRWNTSWSSTELWVFDRATRTETLLLRLPEAKTAGEALSGKYPALDEIFGVSGRVPLLTMTEGQKSYICKYQGGIRKLAVGSNASLSPDRTRIAYSPDPEPVSEAPPSQQLAVMNLQGKTLAKMGAGERPAWSPDGSRLVAIDQDSIRVIDSTTGKELDRISTPRKSETWNFATSAQWSPDGTQILVGGEAGSSTAHYDDFWLLHLADKSWQYLKDGGNDWRWSPDGKSILYVMPRELRPLGHHSVWISHLKLLNVGDLTQRALTEGLSLDRTPSWGLRSAARAR